MARTKAGDRVRIHYTVKLKDGSEVDSSAGKKPLEITLGDDDLFPGFEKAALGLQPGERKRVDVDPEHAFGPHHGELVTTVKRGDLPDGIDPEIGMRLGAALDGGQELELTVTAVDGDEVTLDANHPLAGETLVVEVELVEIL